MAVVAGAAAGIRASRRATVIQLRAPQLSARELEHEALELIRGSPVPVLVSSRIDVALATGAAGANLPDRDVPTHDARALLGNLRLGRSVHSLASALEAEAGGADFVLFGPVWSTASHPNARAVGVGELARVAAAVGIPVLAIGGVTERRIAEVRRAGAAGYAAIRLFA